jgi:hypothetical protein
MNSAIALGVYVGILGTLVVGVLYRPAIALTAVLCLFGLKQWGQTTNSWLAYNRTFTNIAIGVIAVLAIVVSMARGRCILCRIPRVTYLTVLLFLYSWVSLQWVSRPDLAEPLWEEQLPYLLTFILLVPLVVQTTEDFAIAMRWLLGVGGALAFVLLVYGHWGIRGLYVGDARWENETNPLALAGLGGTLVAVAMFLRAGKRSVPFLILRLTLVSAGLLLVVRSGSRGQVIAVVAASLLMLPVAFKFTSLRGLTAATMGLCVIAGSIAFGLSTLIVGLGFGETRWSGVNSIGDAAIRWENIATLLSAWNRNPTTIIFGLGNSASFDPSIIGFYPHNVPAEVLGEEGLLGFLLYVWILIECARSLMRSYALTRTDPARRGLVAAAGAAFLFSFLLTLKQGNMIGSVEFFLFAILLARLGASLGTSETVALEEPRELGARAEVFPNLLR